MKAISFRSAFVACMASLSVVAQGEEIAKQNVLFSKDKYDPSVLLTEQHESEDQSTSDSPIFDSSNVPSIGESIDLRAIEGIDEIPTILTTAPQDFELANRLCKLCNLASREFQTFDVTAGDMPFDFRSGLCRAIGESLKEAGEPEAASFFERIGEGRAYLEKFISENHEQQTAVAITMGRIFEREAKHLEELARSQRIAFQREFELLPIRATVKQKHSSGDFHGHFVDFAATDSAQGVMGTTNSWSGMVLLNASILSRTEESLVVANEFRHQFLVRNPGWRLSFLPGENPTKFRSLVLPAGLFDRRFHDQLQHFGFNDFGGLSEFFSDCWSSKVAPSDFDRMLRSHLFSILASSTLARKHTLHHNMKQHLSRLSFACVAYFPTQKLLEIVLLGSRLNSSKEAIALIEEAKMARDRLRKKAELMSRCYLGISTETDDSPLAVAYERKLATASKEFEEIVDSMGRKFSQISLSVEEKSRLVEVFSLADKHYMAEFNRLAAERNLVELGSDGR